MANNFCYEKPDCERNYISPDIRFITCDCFGRPDGMDGGCWNCRDLTLYQWYMCQDEIHLQVLLGKGMTKAEAIAEIQDYKRRVDDIRQCKGLVDY